MKLDHDCVRDLLLYIEDQVTYATQFRASLVDEPNSDLNYPSSTIVYAAERLLEAGYLDGKVSKFLSGGRTVYIQSITWSGHAFLDNIRPKPAWDKVKAGAKTLGSSSLDILSKVAAQVVTKMLSEQLGL